MLRLKAIITKEPTGGYSARIPSLPGCITEGDTMKELKANLREAAILWMETAQDIEIEEGKQVLEIAL